MTGMTVFFYIDCRTPFGTVFPLGPTFARLKLPDFKERKVFSGKLFPINYLHSTKKLLNFLPKKESLHNNLELSHCTTPNSDVRLL